MSSRLERARPHLSVAYSQNARVRVGPQGWPRPGSPALFDQANPEGQSSECVSFVSSVVAECTLSDCLSLLLVCLCIFLGERVERRHEVFPEPIKAG